MFFAQKLFLVFENDFTNFLGFFTVGDDVSKFLQVLFEAVEVSVDDSEVIFVFDDSHSFVEFFVLPGESFLEFDDVFLSVFHLLH